jgi:phage portal protein BeeE
MAGVPPVSLLDRLMPKPAKASTGIGAIWMTNEPSLRSITGNPQDKMREAQEVATSNRWIRAAERVISHQFGTVPWHLETEDGESVTDESPEIFKQIRDLIEKPYRPLEGDPINATPKTRAGLWSLTCRHTGVCGSSFWYQDETSVINGLPTSLLYINPARMTPVGYNNRLTGWVLDYNARGGGTPLEAKSVLHFTIEEPDDGFFPPGLVETAMSSVNIVKHGDRHAGSTLASGGKRAMVYSPKAEAGILPPDIFAQLEKDLRAANEHPDATRRSIILRGPIDATPVAATPAELDLTSVMAMSRDDILALWGVPLSQLGAAVPAGLNSGSTKSFDEAALWQKAVGPRLERFREVLQFEFLDPIGEKIGQTLQLVVDVPTFDDEAPKYDIAVKAINLPLTNAERRALIGMDPFGNPKIDDAIWMPTGIGPVVPAALMSQMNGGLLTADEARAEAGLGPMQWDEGLSHDEIGALIAEVEAGVLTHDEVRAKMGLGPMEWGEGLSHDETGALIANVEAGLLTHDEARAKMGLGPMTWGEGLSHDEVGALIAEVEAGLITHDEARARLNLGPAQWPEDLSHEEIGAILAKVEGGVMTVDEARQAFGLPTMQWSEDLSKDEVDTLNAQLTTGLLTIDEARAAVGRPTVQWPDDLSEKVKQAKELIDAGFEPDSVMDALNLPRIKHLGLPPVTLQKASDAALILDATTKASLTQMRRATNRITPKLQKAVAAFLAEQKREVVRRVRTSSAHLAKKPSDTSVWWDGDKWDERLAKVLEPYADEIAGMTAKQIAQMLGQE